MIVGGVLIGVAAATLAVWSTAQSANPPAPNGAQTPGGAPIDPVLKHELALLAITQPAAFEAEMNKVKTAEDITAEKIAAFAILNPDAYTAEANRFKTDEQRAKEALSLMAVRNPKAYNAALEPLKTPERRQSEAESAFAILHPQLKSRIAPEPASAISPEQPQSRNRNSQLYKAP